MFCLTLFIVCGQVVLNSGRTLDFKKIKFDKTSIEIKTAKGEKVTLPIDSIAGYVENETFYEKCYVKPLLNTTEATSNQKEHEFLSKKYDGIISIYEKIIYTQGAGMYIPSSKQSFYYFEKNGIVTDLNTPQIITQNERKIVSEFIKVQVQDCAIALEMLNSSLFKGSYSDIFELVRVYNLKMNQPIRNPKNQSTSGLFYSKINKVVKDKIQLTIDDSIKFSIPTYGEIRIPLQTHNYSKVCASIDDISFCTMLVGSPYFSQYYEVEWKPNQRYLSINKVMTEDAKRYIKFIAEKQRIQQQNK